MTRYKTDLYIGDIYVKTYITDADDEQEAHDKFVEMMWEDLMLDTEPIDD